MMRDKGHQLHKTQNRLSHDEVTPDEVDSDFTITH